MTFAVQLKHTHWAEVVHKLGPVLPPVPRHTMPMIPLWRDNRAALSDLICRRTGDHYGQLAHARSIADLHDHPNTGDRA